MRPLLVCAMLLLPCLQVAAAPAPEAGPIVPILTLALQPPLLELQSQANGSVVAHFNGTATVDKPPMVRCVVTLTSSTDIGWVSQVSPTTMVFTNEAPQAFTVDVEVPPGTPTQQGTLVVNGRAVAYGLQSLAEAKAIIDVTGPPLLNITDQNSTWKNATGAGGGVLGGGALGWILSPPGIALLVAVLVAVPTGSYAAIRHRRRRAYLVEG